MSQKVVRYLEADAHISADGVYRYWLSRRWQEPERQRTMVVVGLNPSTADATKDDPTIRRCVGFAKREGCGKLVMVNLFALRSTDPDGLLRHPDPIGPENGQTLNAWIHPRFLCVAAWGAHPLAFERGIRIVQSYDLLRCFGVTKSGAPRHPLYVKADEPLRELRYERVLARGESPSLEAIGNAVAPDVAEFIGRSLLTALEVCPIGDPPNRPNERRVK